jgi:hypothetical protein
MNEELYPGSEATAAVPNRPGGGGVIIDLHRRRLQLLQASVDKTRGKLEKLQRRLIRGELKKGRLRRKLLERKRALSELEQRLEGHQEQKADSGHLTSGQ